MPGPNHRLCRQGDIILFYGLNGVSVGQKIAKGLKIITIVPAVVSAVQIGTVSLSGNASCNHAAIISRITRNPQGNATRFDMAHATGANGIISEDIDNYFLAGGGEAKLFRCRYAGAGDEAAGVAQRWAPPNDGTRKMPFSAGKAFLSALRSSSYGSGAKARAAHFRQYRNTAGGPPGLASTATEMSMFCSMFVISCYQAALADDAATGQVMGLDAKFTSPMTLDGYLRSNGNMWEEVNAIPPPA